MCINMFCLYSAFQKQAFILYPCYHMFIAYKNSLVNFLRQICAVSRIWNPGRDISFLIFIRKEIETRKLERKSKQQISRLNDLLYRLNDIRSR